MLLSIKPTRFLAIPLFVILMVAINCGSDLTDADRKGIDAQLFSHFTQCDSSYFAIDREGQYNTSPKGHLVQFKELSYTTSALPLDSSDSMNGIDWRGSMELHYAGVRSWDPYSIKWGDWQNRYPVHSLILYRQKGAWRLQGHDQFGNARPGDAIGKGFEFLSCGNIPR